MRMEPLDGISALIRRQEISLTLSLLVSKNILKERPCEDRAKDSYLPASQDKEPHHSPNLQHLDLGLPSLQNCEK
jgi:hypothetical protein